MRNNFIKLPSKIKLFSEEDNKFVNTSSKVTYVNYNNIVAIREFNQDLVIVTNEVDTTFQIEKMNAEQFFDMCEKQIHNENFNSKMDKILEK